MRQQNSQTKETKLIKALKNIERKMNGIPKKAGSHTIKERNCKYLTWKIKDLEGFGRYFWILKTYDQLEATGKQILTPNKFSNYEGFITNRGRESSKMD